MNSEPLCATPTMFRKGTGGRTREYDGSSLGPADCYLSNSLLCTAAYGAAAGAIYTLTARPRGPSVPCCCSSATGWQESCSRALYEAVLRPSDKFNYVLMTTGLASWPCTQGQPVLRRFPVAESHTSAVAGYGVF